MKGKPGTPSSPSVSIPASVSNPSSGEPLIPGPEDQAGRRFGFVAILGAPNVGKSTLVNRLTGSKISIVTHKVQTTRTRIRGICLHGETQIVLVDTPGLFRPKRRLERAMVKTAWRSAEDADVVVFLVDAARNNVFEDSQEAMRALKRSGRPCILVLNKIDLIERGSLLAITRAFSEPGVFEDIFMISALTGDGVDDLLEGLVDRMPPGLWLYPEDQVSDIPQQLLAAEITREKLFLRLHQEVPYFLSVEPESWDDKPDGSVRIGQLVYVQREGQKALVLGRGGETIKGIGSEARAELMEILERPVHLFLHVKVRESWADERQRYEAIGLEWEP